MITTSAFDPVFDCQKVFKSLMNALSRPGKIFSIKDSVHMPESDSLRAVALTLLDNRCTYLVWNDAETSELFRELTFGRPGSLEEADYVFVPDAGDAAVCGAILPHVKVGTLAQPHKNATVFVELHNLTGGPAGVLTGPGVDGAISVSLPAQGRAWVEMRQRMEIEFPCGIELFFLTPSGDVMGVPRKAVWKEAE